MLGLVRLDTKRLPYPEVVDAFGWEMSVEIMRMHRRLLRHGISHEFLWIVASVGHA